MPRIDEVNLSGDPEQAADVPVVAPEGPACSHDVAYQIGEQTLPCKPDGTVIQMDKDEFGNYTRYPAFNHQTVLASMYCPKCGVSYSMEWVEGLHHDNIELPIDEGVGQRLEPPPETPTDTTQAPTEPTTTDPAA